METKAIDNTIFLGLENQSLKLHIAKRNLQDAQIAVQAASTALQNAAAKALNDEGLSPDEWGVDLDKKQFVQKPK